MSPLLAELGAQARVLTSPHMQDAAIYLLPSILLALLIRYLTNLHPIFLSLRLAGTACHELAHFIVGLCTGARPRSFSLIPRRQGDSWQLGVVMLANVRWYNAAPAALAPLGILAIPAMVALWRTRSGLHFTTTDIAVAFLLAPQFLSFFPSPADWKIAIYSWPYFLIGGGVWWAFSSIPF